ncbi:MAG: nicotinamide-nucleotide amidohydrolase family protein [Verrucomicrobiae bacterium]|nr:nicotinamide-nucleotide amidohydrolase family protein [Verrucomicrobiae bacterium]
MIVEIVNTGSELMLGRVLNTHQQWLCRRLADLGHVVSRQVAVADTGGDIQTAVREALGRADLVITTGGLGPTSDDITRELIAALLGKKLVENKDVLAHIEGYFARRNRTRPAGTSVETFVPEGALVFINQFGTAPGLAMEVNAECGVRSAELGEQATFNAQHSKPNIQGGGKTISKKWLIMLPGPPRELRPMFDNSIVPLLKKEFADETFVCRTLRSVGVGESRVQEAIEDSLKPLVPRGLEVGYCARPWSVDVRLTAAGPGAAQIVGEGEAIVQRLLGAHIFGYDDDEIENVIVRLLTERKQTLALAESCTGGNIAHRLTNVPGASAVLLGGVVSYANSAKEKLIGVRAKTLEQYGAVSEEVAREMTLGAREKFGADFAIAVTGIAGPGGGTAEKPVGTVYIALASVAGVEVKKMLNPWDRATFKEVTATQALEGLRGLVKAAGGG